MMTPEQAQEIWARRGIQNTISEVVTPEEDAEIMARWEIMDDGCSYMSAFFSFLNGVDIPAMIRQWWEEYRTALADPMNRLGKMDRVNALTDQLRKAGVSMAGPMIRTGAEDIAAECDRLRDLA